LIMDFCIYLLAAPGKYSAVGSHSASIRVWNGEVIYILLYLLKTLSIHLANRYRLSSAYKYLLPYKYNFSTLYQIWKKKKTFFLVHEVSGMEDWLLICSAMTHWDKK
jgi:hypothetical protein